MVADIPTKTKLTPVRYPGGKSNALKFLDQYFIKDFQEYREPFFGGGSVGLYLMQFNKDADYWINDLYYPVYCFWRSIYERPEDMVKFLTDIKKQSTISTDTVVKGIPSKNAENGRNLHTYCRSTIPKKIVDGNEFETACLWYILNKTSYSGMSMIGSYAPLAWDQNFSFNCINKLPTTCDLLRSVRSLSITNVDYSILLAPPKTDKKVFIYLDPPYKIPHNLYGNQGDMHRGFDHELFAETTLKCQDNWMITYNEDKEIQNWFKDHNQLVWDLQYTMKSAKRLAQDGTTDAVKSGKTGKELLIKNYLI